MSLRPKKLDFTDVWNNEVLPTVRGIVSCGRVERSMWNTSIFHVYSLCVAIPEPLVGQLYDETKRFLESHVQALYQDLVNCAEDQILFVYHKHWQQYSKGAKCLGQLYGYFNTHFTKKKNQKANTTDIDYGSTGMNSTKHMVKIGELALNIWKEIMIESLKSSLVSLLLSDIQKSRTGQTVNQAALHAVINSFVEVEQFEENPIEFYEELYETSFLRESRKYYRQEAMKLYDKCTCSEFIEKVIQTLDDENFRSRKFLHYTSYAKVTHECNQRLVAEYRLFLLAHCKEIVTKEIVKDLSNMYRILQPINNGLMDLAVEVESHITRVLLEAVAVEQTPQQHPMYFVKTMLELHNKYTELIQTVFNGDQLFVHAMDRAFKAAVNYKQASKSQCHSPKLLSQYCDNLLRKTTKGMRETEIDDQLAQSMVVFRYLDDKDYYQKFYAQMMARRLIFAQSVFMEMEEAMISRLKISCGHEFTNKLHRMYTDMKISHDLREKFSGFVDKQVSDGEPGLGINFNMLVLQDGAWPIGQSKQPSFNLPQELERSIQLFKQFYDNSFSGRKLSLIPNFCQADLKLTYLSKSYFVTVGLFHMSMLLPFNNSTTVTEQELLDTTGLPVNELHKHIKTLLDTKLLLSQITDGDTTYSLSMSYSNKRTKFKITTALQRDNTQDVENTHGAADKDRKICIQAAIVRTMKVRKVMKHNLLVQEVISQSQARFTPSMGMIKKCIEILIDKLYLQRTENSTDEYSYVA